MRATTCHVGEVRLGARHACKTARTVQGHQRLPPWAVGTPSRFTSSAIAARVLPKLARRELGLAAAYGAFGLGAFNGGRLLLLGIEVAAALPRRL